MRHHKAHRKFGREKRVRVALLRNLARSLILKEAITTTIAKAKEIRPYVEKLITHSKHNTLASHRHVESVLGGASDVVLKLRNTIAPRYATRAGGYVRITRLGKVGKRVLESARIELVK